MNWNKLFDMQADLDKYIEENHDIQQVSNFDNKILALLVEVGELANETRCFKFWSTKEPSGREVILEEFVDGIHFLMSIGLDKNYRFNGHLEGDSHVDLVKQFTDVFSMVTTFKQNPDENNYHKMFSVYLQLGRMLGYTSKEIQEAYTAKNDTNYQRQDNGY